MLIYIYKKQNKRIYNM